MIKHLKSNSLKVMLSDPELEKLELLCKLMKLNKSEVVRQFINNYSIN